MAETKTLRHEELAESHPEMEERRKNVVAIAEMTDEGK